MSISSDNNIQNSSVKSTSNNWYCLHPQQAVAEQTQLLASESIVKLPLNNRGLAYADGFFTTMAIENGEILWADYHWQRLSSHADALRFDLPKSSLLFHLKSHAKQLEQGVMKVIVTRAEQTMRGYGFSADSFGNACEIWLKTMPATSSVEANSLNTIQTAVNTNALSVADGQSIIVQTPTKAICLTSQIACLPPTLAGLKTLNRLDNVLASGEFENIKANSLNKSLDKELGEGLLRDMSGHWVEGTMSNVFYQLSATQNDDTNYANNPDYLTKGQWFTPLMTQSGVAGVMRQVIIDSLATSENPVMLRSLSDDDLPKLSQLFFCNAVRGVMPVARLTLLSGEVVELSL